MYTDNHYRNILIINSSTLDAKIIVLNHSLKNEMRMRKSKFIP